MRRLPIGDVIMYGVYKNKDNKEPLYVYTETNNYAHIAQSQLWWCPFAELEELSDICKTWEGFKLCVGNRGHGTKDTPEVIEHEWQERRQDNQFTVSTKGDEALITDVMVWLDVIDTEKAYEYLQEHSDIPVAIRCDMYRYSTDERYKQVFDIANDYFIYYLYNERPKNISKDIDIDDIKRYDI